MTAVKKVAASREETAAKLAASLVGLGYHVITLLPSNHPNGKFEAQRGKAPGVCSAGIWHLEREWNSSETPATVEQVTHWIGQTNLIPNFGAICGVPVKRDGKLAGHLVGIDVDCDDQGLIDDLHKLLNYNSHLRVGQRGGVIPVVVGVETSPDIIGRDVARIGNDGRIEKVQLLGRGKQFVISGIHPKTAKSYTWYDALGCADFVPPISELPIVKLDDLLTLLEAHGFSRGNSADSMAPVGKAEEQELIARMSGADDQEFDELFVSSGCRYNLEELRADNRNFAKLFDHPRDDFSSNRLAAAKDMMRQWPRFEVESFRVFCLGWEGAGEYVASTPGKGQFDDRQVVRQYADAKKALRKESGADHFEPVIDEDEGASRSEGGKVEAVSRDQSTVELDRKRVVKFVYAEDIGEEAAQSLDYAVKGVIARGTTSMMSSHWGHGKTAVALDICGHIACGIDWNGRKVTRGVVVYCGLENPLDIERRWRTWRDRMAKKANDVSKPALVFYRARLGLFSKDGNATPDEKDLIKIALDAREHYGLPLAMVVVDTLSKSIRPGSESNDDAAIYVQSLQRICDATGANVMALAHPPKSGAGVRGGGAFEADVDTVLVIENKNRVFTLKADSEKFRIGNPAKVAFKYKLVGIEVGKDDDGDPIEVVQAVFLPASNVDTAAELSDMDGAEEDDIGLARASRVEDSTAFNLTLLKEALVALVKKSCFSDERTVSQPNLVAEWNRRRKRYIGTDGEELATRDDKTQVRRLLKTLQDEGFLLRNEGRPVTVTLLAAN